MMIGDDVHTGRAAASRFERQPMTAQQADNLRWAADNIEANPRHFTQDRDPEMVTDTSCGCVLHWLEYLAGETTRSDVPLLVHLSTRRMFGLPLRYDVWVYDQLIRNAAEAARRLRLVADRRNWEAAFGPGGNE